MSKLKIKLIYYDCDSACKNTSCDIFCLELVPQQRPDMPSLLSSVVPLVPLIVAEPLPLQACSLGKKISVTITNTEKVQFSLYLHFIENQPPPPPPKKTQCHRVQVAQPPCTVTLSETTSVIGEALAGGHLPSVASAILEQEELHDTVVHLFMEKINITDMVLMKSIAQCTHPSNILTLGIRD